MPLRPFPYPFRVGTDICHIPRIRSLITRGKSDDSSQMLDRFLKRVLTGPERDYFHARFETGVKKTLQYDTIARFLAGRFAAKEACRKACEHFNKSSRGYYQIMILPIGSFGQIASKSVQSSSAPQGLILDHPWDDDTDINTFGNESMSSVKDLLHGQLCPISISHDGDYATAIAVVPIIHKLGDIKFEALE
ncbi:hypothetical protein ACN47E_006772 [Coniothyrium glycines]